jgi:hypothetical protein
VTRLRPDSGPGAACQCGRPDCIIPDGKRAHAKFASVGCKQLAYRRRVEDPRLREETSRAFWRGIPAVRPSLPGYRPNRSKA